VGGGRERKIVGMRGDGQRGVWDCRNEKKREKMRRAMVMR
jgi:hypothetical protein